MSLDALKRELAALSPAEQSEVTAFLFRLRHAVDTGDYQAAVERRLSDRDPTHWLTPGEFERRLDQR